MPFFTQKYVHGKDNYIQITRDINYCHSYGRWAGFIQGTSILHNPLFAFEKEFYDEYWREFDSIIDYVLMDFTTDMAYDDIPFVHSEIDAVPINNVDVWTLLKYLNAPYSEYPYDKLLDGNFLNKLSWKVPLDPDADNTVFREIQRRYAPETIK